MNTQLIRKATIIFIAALLALVFASCPNDAGDPTTVSVTGVSITASHGEGDTSTIWINTSHGDGKQSFVILTAVVEPSNATNKGVTWEISPDPNTFVTFDEDEGIFTIQAEEIGEITVTVATDDGSFEASHTVKVLDPNTPVDDDSPELELYNQAASPVAGTTDDLANAWNATTKKYTISNAESGAGFTAGDSGNGNNGVVNTTIVYLNQTVAVNSSISARVRISKMNGTEPTGSNGVIMGLMSDPKGDVHFMGIRASTGGLWRVYQSRTSNTNSSSALATNASTGYGERRVTVGTSNTDWSQINGVDIPFNEEFILEVNRTAAAAFTISMKDYAGNTVTTGTNAGSLLNIDPAYIGFIIANAEVEISQIVIKEGGTELINTGASDPTPTPATSVEFTAPSVTGNATDGYEYTHSTAGGNNTLSLTAKALPARAPQVISWTISGTGASLNANSGASVTATLTSVGNVIVTAEAGTASAELTIAVTAGSIPVTSIAISAEGDATSIMAGDGAGNDPETLLFIAEVEPENATNPVITWHVSASDSYEGQPSDAAEISAGGLLTFKEDFEFEDEDDDGEDDEVDVWVFAAAADTSGVKSNRVKVTLKPYSAPVVPTYYYLWEAATSSAFSLTTGGSTASLGTPGKNWVASSSNAVSFTAGTSGIELNARRFSIGTNSIAATTTSSYHTEGQLDFSVARKLTITYSTAGTSGNFQVYLNNNTTGQGTSVLGNPSRLYSASPSAGTNVELVINTVPSTFSNHASLATAFIQIRTEGGRNVTIHKILIE